MRLEWAIFAVVIFVFSACKSSPPPLSSNETNDLQQTQDSSTTFEQDVENLLAFEKQWFHTNEESTSLGLAGWKDVARELTVIFEGTKFRVNPQGPRFTYTLNGKSRPIADQLAHESAVANRGARMEASAPLTYRDMETLGKDGMVAIPHGSVKPISTPWLSWPNSPTTYTLMTKSAYEAEQASLLAAIKQEGKRTDRSGTVKVKGVEHTWTRTPSAYKEDYDTFVVVRTSTGEQFKVGKSFSQTASEYVHATTTNLAAATGLAAKILVAAPAVTVATRMLYFRSPGFRAKIDELLFWGVQSGYVKQAHINELSKKVFDSFHVDKSIKIADFVTMIQTNQAAYASIQNGLKTYNISSLVQGIKGWTAPAFQDLSGAKYLHELNAGGYPVTEKVLIQYMTLVSMVYRHFPNLVPLPLKLKP